MKVYIGPYRKNRRIDIRIDSYDTWSMDSTLSFIILPMLKQLKEAQHGSALMPAHEQTSTSSVQYTFDFYAEDDKKAWEEGHKQWNEIMDHMIWTFEEQVKEETDENYSFQMLDLPTEEYLARSDKMQEGYELFGKYYRNLWD